MNDIEFSYDAELRSSAADSCFATLNDELWVIGGRYRKRHVRLNGFS